MNHLSPSEVAREVLETHETTMSDWVRVSCPFCVTRIGKDDRRRSFGVNCSSGFFHCFRCGIKGKIKGEEFDDAFSKPYVPVEKQEIEKPEGYVPLWMEPGLNAEALSDARCYLRGRGFGRKTWEAAKIGACYRGYFSNRVIVPIIEDYKWYGFVARDWVGNAERKYLYPLGMNRTELLWQKYLLYEDSPDPVIIVEGVFDALPYYGSAVACLGKPTHRQIEMIKQAKRPIAVVLDGDAWEEGYALSQRLRLNGNNAGYVKLPAGEDPGSVDCGWLLEETIRCIGS